jgi:DNA-binding protein HU-beta
MAARKKMSKTELATELASATGTNKKTAVAFVEALSNIAYREARKAGEFTIPGVGKLVKNKSVKKIRFLNRDSNICTQVSQSSTVMSIPVEREIKDSPVRGKFSRRKIRAAVQAVARRHSAT